MSLETNWPDDDERDTFVDDVPLVLTRLAIGLVADFIGRNLRMQSKVKMLSALPQSSNPRHPRHGIARHWWLENQRGSN